MSEEVYRVLLIGTCLLQLSFCSLLPCLSIPGVILAFIVLSLLVCSDELMLGSYSKYSYKKIVLL